MRYVTSSSGVFAKRWGQNYRSHSDAEVVFTDEIASELVILATGKNELKLVAGRELLEFLESKRSALT